MYRIFAAIGVKACAALIVEIDVFENWPFVVEYGHRSTSGTFIRFAIHHLTADEEGAPTLKREVCGLWIGRVVASTFTRS
jgi:hypothetical protein